MNKSKDEKKLQEILGGSSPIRNQKTAWDLRTRNIDFLNKKTQPVLFSIIEKQAKKKGMTIQEYQKKY